MGRITKHLHKLPLGALVDSSLFSFIFSPYEMQIFINVNTTQLKLILSRLLIHVKFGWNTEKNVTTQKARESTLQGLGDPVL